MERYRKHKPLHSLRAKFRPKHSQFEAQKLPEHSKPHATSSLIPPPRWPGRQFHRCVQTSPVSPEARQKILTTFDFENAAAGQPVSEPVISELEEWMGYQGWPWVDEHDRARIIRDKAFNTLKKFLVSLGFVFLSSLFPSDSRTLSLHESFH